MLSIPTVWLLFVVNFSALGLVWAYVLRGHPNFLPARYWGAATGCAALGAAVALLRGVVDSPMPLVLGSTLMVLANCLGMMGIFRFFRQPSGWLVTAVVTGVSAVAIAIFTYVAENMAMRIVVYSIAHAIPIALTLRYLLSRSDRRTQPGIWLTALVSALILAVLAIRSVAALLGIGGELQTLHFNVVQACLVVLLAFLSMLWGISFLLLSFDRHRNEMASLALVDELTGVANRRQALQRLNELCTEAQLSGMPFTVLAIDLDGFKGVNDRYGHGAGDDCLRAFARAAQERLRPDYLLARVGGDEFSILMPRSTTRDGALIARSVVEACQVQRGQPFDAISASIGVAQWTCEIGNNPDRLIAAADQALYAAKKNGKNRYAIYEPTPSTLAAAATTTLLQSPEITGPGDGDLCLPDASSFRTAPSVR